MTVNHLMASSAIPIFFPSIRIGGRHFGDGSIRNTAPLSPAINLGADRIVAIGVQGPGSATPVGRKRSAPPTIAQIAGVLLDAVMLDAIETDVEHSSRVNRSVMHCRAGSTDPFRWVDVLWLTPSADIRAIAARRSRHVPPLVRYLMRGLGSDRSISELLSYLLFAPAFTTQLIALGRADVHAAAAEIRSFLTESRSTDERFAAADRRRRPI